MANPFSWRVLDGLLRGTLKPDQTRGLIISLLFWQVILAAIYGACLGLFGLAVRDVADPRFIASSACKLPVLILGSTLVTFPSLYVFLAQFGVRLSFGQMLAAALSANTILATVIASLGPVIGFFCLTTQSYPFILLLNVVICGLGGLLGVRLIMLAINKALPGSAPAADPERFNPESKSKSEAGDKDEPKSWEVEDPSKPVPGQSTVLSLGGGARGIMMVWLVLFAFVGTQMAWILRPFIGHPAADWVLFRGREGSFADAVMNAFSQYLGG